MKKATALYLLAALLLGATAVLAGEESEEHKKKCAADASACVRDMAANLKKKGWVGIEWDDSDGRPRISHVVAGSPAAAAGIRVGDVVMAFHGIATDQEDEKAWAEMKRALVPGRTITISLVRDGVPLELPVELVAVPDHIIAQWVGMHMLEYHAAPAADEAAESP